MIGSIAARGAVERGVAVVISLGINRSVFLCHGCRSLVVAGNAQEVACAILDLVLAFGFGLNELPSEECIVGSSKVCLGHKDTLCTCLCTGKTDEAIVAVVAGMIEYEAGHGFRLGLRLSHGEFSLGVGSHGGEVELTGLGLTISAVRSLFTNGECQILHFCVTSFPNNHTVLSVVSDCTLGGGNVSPALLTLGGDVEDKFADVLGRVAHHHNVFCVGTEVRVFGIDGGFGRPRLFRCLNAPISLS